LRPPAREISLYSKQFPGIKNFTMDSAEVHSLIEDLDSSIDDLEDALKPLLSASISTTAAGLSVLERAKLYVLITYTIESLIFSHVRLSGADAKEHPVFRELARVKQYFEKIDSAEHPVGKRENLSLNKPAAARFIKAGLAGNIKFDEEQEQRKMKELGRARARLEKLNKKRKGEDGSAENSDSSSDSEEESPVRKEASESKSKKNKRVKVGEEQDASSSKKNKKEKSKGKEKSGKESKKLRESG
jgi:exosome complex protein LRP1